MSLCCNLYSLLSFYFQIVHLANNWLPLSYVRHKRVTRSTSRMETCQGPCIYNRSVKERQWISMLHRAQSNPTHCPYMVIHIIGNYIVSLPCQPDNKNNGTASQLVWYYGCRGSNVTKVLLYKIAKKTLNVLLFV